jgi:uncharacterized protein
LISSSAAPVRDPPNLASDRFHAAFGFADVGGALLAERGKTVRYLALSI